MSKVPVKSSEQVNVVKPHPFEVGKAYYLRAVTYHMVGKVVAVNGSWLTLSDASWVADTGRFGEFITDGTVSESENVGDTVCHVNVDAVTDVFEWNHPLPLPTK
jgi:hypothetical protein